ncbi:MAG: hypothetical protein ACRYFS_24490 [Janthinobacterium lividum]
MSLPLHKHAASHPPRCPARYLKKEIVVRNWHGYHLEHCGGECPSLKWLAGECRLSITTVHRLCAALSLPLSQSRPRRSNSECG